MDKAVNSKTKTVSSFLPIPMRYEFKVTWNYSATSHGKGAVGGIGGLIKGLAMTSLVTQQAIIKDATGCHLR